MNYFKSSPGGGWGAAWGEACCWAAWGTCCCTAAWGRYLSGLVSVRLRLNSSFLRSRMGQKSHIVYLSNVSDNSVWITIWESALALLFIKHRLDKLCLIYKWTLHTTFNYTSQHLTTPHIISKYLTTPHYTSYYLKIPSFTSLHLPSPLFTSHYLTTSPQHLTLPHNTSQHLTLPH